LLICAHVTHSSPLFLVVLRQIMFGIGSVPNHLNTLIGTPLRVAFQALIAYTEHSSACNLSRSLCCLISRSRRTKKFSYPSRSRPSWSVSTHTWASFASLWVKSQCSIHPCALDINGLTRFLAMLTESSMPGCAA